MDFRSGVFSLAAATRERQGMSLAQISQSTKIGTRYLEAIESERFELLPGGVYNVSYIRQYAQAINFDEYELLAAYRRTPAGAASAIPEAERSAEGSGKTRLSEAVWAAINRTARVL